MDIPLIVTSEKDIPLYLQLKNQISYLISSRQLAEDSRLPAVHELAKTLSINPGTVARAYRELQASNLIISLQGKGTFVRAMLSDDDDDYSVRHKILVQVLEESRTRGHALGFNDVEIQQELYSLQTMKECQIESVFVASVMPVSQRFAGIVGEYLNGKLRLHPLAMESLKWKDPIANKILESVYYFITTTRLVHRVEQALHSSPHPWKVLEVSSEVTKDTLNRLDKLAPNKSVCLIVQENFLHSALNLIQTFSTLDINDLPFAFDTNPDDVVKITKEAELVIHTFGVKALIDHLEIPVFNRLELEFDINPDSLEKLKKFFASP